jgi:hypothetical protein
MLKKKMRHSESMQPEITAVPNRGYYGGLPSFVAAALIGVGTGEADNQEPTSIAGACWVDERAVWSVVRIRAEWRVRRKGQWLQPNGSPGI